MKEKQKKRKDSGKERRRERNVKRKKRREENRGRVRKSLKRMRNSNSQNLLQIPKLTIQQKMMERQRNILTRERRKE